MRCSGQNNQKIVCALFTALRLSPKGKNALDFEKERRYYGYKASIARFFHYRYPGLWAAKTYRTHTSPFTGMALFYFLFLFFSILGIFYQGYFYVYHGFGIIVGNEILDRAIKVSKAGYASSQLTCG